jgi:hypothetical protein
MSGEDGKKELDGWEGSGKLFRMVRRMKGRNWGMGWMGIKGCMVGRMGKSSWIGGEASNKREGCMRRMKKRSWKMGRKPEWMKKKCNEGA